MFKKRGNIYISMGEVKVNGKIINQLGYKIKSGDKVNFNGQELLDKKIFILF